MIVQPSAVLPMQALPSSTCQYGDQRTRTSVCPLTGDTIVRLSDPSWLNHPAPDAMGVDETTCQTRQWVSA